MKKVDQSVRIRFGIRILGFLTVLFCLPPAPAGAPDRAANKVIIKNVKIFDGLRVIISDALVIQEGIIIQVTESGLIGDEGNVIDGTGMTLLPGLFDAHVHVWSLQNLKQALIFGVTSVVDMFMPVKTMTEIKKNQSHGQYADAAYLVSAGTLATAQGGHGTEYRLDIQTITRPEEAQAFVDNRIAEGSDFIKIIWDDGSAYGMAIPTLDKPTVKALIDAAHNRDKKVIVHAATLAMCVEAVSMGADGLAHLFFEKGDPGELVRLASQKKAFVIPTLSVLEGMQGLPGGRDVIEDPFLSPFLTPTDTFMLQSPFSFSSEKGAFLSARQATGQLKSRNVPILAGTDTPNPGTTFGASLHRELELLVDAGLSPTEALSAATAIPADTFGLDDRGRILPGKIADLLLVNGDPTQDIKKTREIVHVWRKGKLLDRDSYRKSVKIEKEKIEKQKDTPAPMGSESGWISDFEGDNISANFGGWSVSTDSIMGGKSKASYILDKQGAHGSIGCLKITGTVDHSSSTPWAGAFFSPGDSFMAPSNLSSKKSLHFLVKGDEMPFSVMIFAQSKGFIPLTQTFTAGPVWKELEFPFKDFGTDGHDIMGIFIGSSAKAGSFTLWIDDVRLK